MKKIKKIIGLACFLFGLSTYFPAFAGVAEDFARLHPYHFDLRNISEIPAPIGLKARFNFEMINGWRVSENWKILREGNNPTTEIQSVSAGSQIGLPNHLSVSIRNFSSPENAKIVMINNLNPKQFFHENGRDIAETIMDKKHIFEIPEQKGGCLTVIRHGSNNTHCFIRKGATIIRSLLAHKGEIFTGKNLYEKYIKNLFETFENYFPADEDFPPGYSIDYKEYENYRASIKETEIVSEELSQSDFRSAYPNLIDIRDLFFTPNSTVHNNIAESLYNRRHGFGYETGGRKDIVQAYTQFISGDVSGDVSVYIDIDNAPSAERARQYWEKAEAGFPNHKNNVVHSIDVPNGSGGCFKNQENLYCAGYSGSFIFNIRSNVDHDLNTLYTKYTIPFLEKITSKEPQNTETKISKPAEIAIKFPDLKIDSLEGEAARFLAKKNIINGQPNGDFDGNSAVSRAAAAKFLLNSANISIENTKQTLKFSDVNKKEWYFRYVAKALEKGIINGYNNFLFKPGETVSTAEFLSMFTKAFGLPKNVSYEYDDVFEINWFSTFAGIAQEYDLFPNRDKNKLNPHKKLTRNEVAIALYQYLKNK